MTALQLKDVDLGPPEPLHFLTTSAGQVRRPGLQVTRVRTLPPHRDRVVSAEAAFVTAASTLDLVDLVAAGDWLVKLRLVTPESLVSACGAVRLRGCASAPRAASLVRARVDSVRETRLRVLLVLAGLPEPRCNVALGSDKRFIGTVDLVYQAYHVILEYEGDHHRSDKAQWNSDIGRYEEFTADGWTVIRVTSAHLAQPVSLVNRVHEALRSGGYDGPPPALTPKWRELFVQ